MPSCRKYVGVFDGGCTYQQIVLVHQLQIHTCKMFDLLIYLLKTFSICFCWKRPLITSWLFPSMDPLEARRHCLRYRRNHHFTFDSILEMQLKAHHVPNSANRNAKRCLGCRCNLKMKMQICKSLIDKITQIN